MNQIPLDYHDALGLRQLVYRAKKESEAKNDTSWQRACDYFMLILDQRIKDSVNNA